MSLVNRIAVPSLPIARLESVIGTERHERLLATTAAFGERLDGHTIWNINSTAAGGGVAEMLQTLVGYATDLAIPIEWLVISGDPDFFATTKRLHNQIHGAESGGPFTAAEAEHYDRISAANAAELLDVIRPGDIVLLHDPQTAGLAEPLARLGAHVVWRCHIGVDWDNAATDSAWSFLRRHIEAAHGFVFTRRQYVPAWMPRRQTWIIPPSIDPFSPKNQDLDPKTVRSILATIGVLGGTPERPGYFTRYDGSTGTVTRPAAVTADELPAPDQQLVVQISRWDRLKDMGGVMQAFVDHVAPHGDGYLLLVGPSVKEVADDPEGAVVYDECLRQWGALPAKVRRRVALVTLAMDDVEENAAMVNAIQRHSAVLAQKSIAEGFGLTVSEGMWKGKPVLGSAVGGINDQIADGTGILLSDPTDLAAFGTTVRRLLDDPVERGDLGRAARAHVSEYFVGDLHLLRYAELFGTLLTG